MPVDGSKARHKSTRQYYRDIQKLADDLKAEVVDLQQQKETAREELRGDEAGSCHRPKAHCRVVQGAIREVKAEHSPTYTTAKERQGNEDITVLSR